MESIVDVVTASVKLKAEVSIAAIGRATVTFRMGVGVGVGLGVGGGVGAGVGVRIGRTSPRVKR